MMLNSSWKKNCSAQWDKTELNPSVVGRRFCIFGLVISIHVVQSWYTCNVCYDYGFISAKINGPYFEYRILYVLLKLMLIGVLSL